MFLHKYGDAMIAVLLIVVLAAWPNIDLTIASLFYVPGVGFPAKEFWWVKLVYETMAHLWVLVFIFLFLILASYVPRCRLFLSCQRKALVYLLIALIIGPGLITNSLFKNNWGRPRPVHLEQFGGAANFTGLLTPSRQCAKNCSLPSGHAAGAFFLMAGYWLTRRRGWLASGIAFGIFVGYIRMAMGAHFLSDIVFSGVVIYFTCKWLASLFGFTATIPRLTRVSKPANLAS